MYFLKKKSNTITAFKPYKNLVENQTGKTIKRLRTDNGQEYLSLEHFFKDCGIHQEKSIARNPQQNGRAEWVNRTLLDKARCLLLDANLSKKFWVEAVSTAAHLSNRSPKNVLEWKNTGAIVDW